MFSQSLKKARKRLGFSQAKLAKALDVAQSTVGMWESGKREPDLKRLAEIAELFSVSTDFLLGKSPEVLPVQNYDSIYSLSHKTVPLIGSIAAGQPIVANQLYDSEIEIGQNIKCDFCLKVKGDSMINARIGDGDIVFIKEQPDVENGQIAAVIIDEAVTLKRVYKTGATLTLVSENPRYQPITVTEDNCNYARILGRAVAVLSETV